jgi:hypothetical protein
MHSGIGQNLAYRFYSADSEPGVSGEESQDFHKHLFGRVNVASGEKIIKPQDILSVFVPGLIKAIQ